MKNKTFLELHIVKLEQRRAVTFPNYGNTMELPWKLFSNNNFQENCSSKANFTGNILEIYKLATNF